MGDKCCFLSITFLSLGQEQKVVCSSYLVNSFLLLVADTAKLFCRETLVIY